MESVGIIIIARSTNNFLLLHRAKPPIAWSTLTGKMEKGEKPMESIKREIQEENLEIVQIYDISADVFNPYYSYFLKIYIKQKRLPEWVANILIWYAHTVQPFSYIVASCKNKLNCIS